MPIYSYVSCILLVYVCATRGFSWKSLLCQNARHTGFTSRLISYRYASAVDDKNELEGENIGAEKKWKRTVTRSSDSYGDNHCKNVTVSRQDLRELCEPLLDRQLVQETIEQWTRPLPQKYLSRPMILVGPSGVGKGRLVKALLKDYTRFFEKVVTHTTRKPRPDEVNGTDYHFVSNETFHAHIAAIGNTATLGSDHAGGNRAWIANGSSCGSGNEKAVINQTNITAVTEIKDSMIYSRPNYQSCNGMRREYFVEWAQVHNNFYGTSVASWQNVTQKGKIPIMEIDIQGAKSIARNVRKFGIWPWFVFVAPTDMHMLQDRLRLRGTETEEEVSLRLQNAELEVTEARNRTDLFKHILVNDDFPQTVNKLFRLVRDHYPAIPSAARIRMLQRRIKKVKKMALEKQQERNAFPTGPTSQQQQQQE